MNDNLKRVLRRVLEQHNMIGRNTAQEAGLQQSFISRILNGRTATPSLKSKNMKKLLEVIPTEDCKVEIMQAYFQDQAAALGVDRAQIEVSVPQRKKAPKVRA